MYDDNEPVVQPGPAQSPEPSPQGSDNGRKGGDPDPAAATARELKELREQLERANRRSQELELESRFWADKARGTRSGESEDEDEPEARTRKTKPVAEEEDVPEDPDKFGDLLIKRGPAAIDAYLKKKGYVSREEAEAIADKKSRERIQNERGKISREARLASDFPDLQNPDSELYKRTAKYLREAVAEDPSAAKSPTALYLAAKAAKAELAAETRTAAPSGDDEEERLAHIRRQSGDRSRATRGRETGADDDDRLGDTERDLISRMGIKEEDFLAERKRLGTARRAR